MAGDKAKKCQHCLSHQQKCPTNQDCDKPNIDLFFLQFWSQIGFDQGGRALPEAKVQAKETATHLSRCWDVSPEHPFALGENAQILDHKGLQEKYKLVDRETAIRIALALKDINKQEIAKEVFAENIYRHLNEYSNLATWDACSLLLNEHENADLAACAQGVKSEEVLDSLRGKIRPLPAETKFNLVKQMKTVEVVQKWEAMDTLNITLDMKVKVFCTLRNGRELGVFGGVMETSEAWKNTFDFVKKDILAPQPAIRRLTGTEADLDRTVALLDIAAALHGTVSREKLLDWKLTETDDFVLNVELQSKECEDLDWCSLQGTCDMSLQKCRCNPGFSGTFCRNMTWTEARLTEGSRAPIALACWGENVAGGRNPNYCAAMLEYGTGEVLGHFNFGDGSTQGAYCGHIPNLDCGETGIPGVKPSDMVMAFFNSQRGLVAPTWNDQGPGGRIVNQVTFEDSFYSTWALACTGARPSKKVGVAFTGAAGLGSAGKAWAFGGKDASSTFRELYELDYNHHCTWTKVKQEPDKGPPGLFRASLTYADNQLILFGGQRQRQDDSFSNELWVASLLPPARVSWKKEPQPEQAPQPAGRMRHGSAWDSGSRRLIIYGGSNNQQLTDLWFYDVETKRWFEFEAPPQPVVGQHCDFAVAWVETEKEKLKDKKLYLVELAPGRRIFSHKM